MLQETKDPAGFRLAAADVVMLGRLLQNIFTD